MSTPESIFDPEQKLSMRDLLVLRQMGGHLFNLPSTPAAQQAQLVMQFALQLAPATMGAQGGVGSTPDVRAELCWKWAMQLVEHMPTSLREHLLAPPVGEEFPPVDDAS